MTPLIRILLGSRAKMEGAIPKLLTRRLWLDLGRSHSTLSGCMG
jgi:hypothetical protein